MTFDEYQTEAIKTVYKVHEPMMEKTIMALGIAGEAGEVADKWKKILGYHDGVITPEDIAELSKEMGDVLWYLALFAENLGLKLDDIARENNAKLASRHARGAIKGKGDNR